MILIIISELINQIVSLPDRELLLVLYGDEATGVFFEFYKVLETGLGTRGDGHVWKLFGSCLGVVSEDGRGLDSTANGVFCKIISPRMVGNQLPYFPTAS